MPLQITYRKNGNGKRTASYTNGNGYRKPYMSKVYYNPSRPTYGTVARTMGPLAGKGEMKYFDAQVASTFLIESTTWASCEFDPLVADALFTPTQGAGISQRIGREVNVYKIKLRGTIIVDVLENQTEVKGPTCMRLVLVQDTQTNQAQLAAENVFKTGIGPNGFNGFLNLDSLGRYRILKEKIITIQDPNILHDGTNIEMQGLLRWWKMNHTFKVPVKVRYNGVNSGQVEDVIDNSFHLLVNGTGVDLLPQINYVVRTSYKEK